MTALCPGGGPSGPRPGVDSSIQFNGTQVAAALAITGEEELAALVAVITSGTVLATDLFCATDPPAAPTLTDQDFADAKNPLNVGAFTTAAGRIKDWFLNWYWNQICECTGGATPSPPVLVLPHGTGTGTGLPTGTTNNTCWDVRSSFPVPRSPNPASFSGADLHQTFLPANPTISIPAGSGIPAVLAPAIPPGVTQGFWKATCDVANPSPNGNDIVVRLWNDTGTFIGNAISMTFDQNAPLSQTGTFTIPSTATHWDCFWVNYDTTRDYNFTFEFAFYCSGQTPLTLVTPCCPPDPLVQNYLQLILNLVQNLYTNPPGTTSTGWADGTVHAGLSGTGSFQLQPNVTGIRANFTTIPTGIRVTAGTPTFYWDLGFVTPVAQVVPLRSLRTVFQSQAMALPAQTTAIDYTFPTGVVVTLTELLPA